jgi:hypothetical protein
MSSLAPLRDAPPARCFAFLLGRAPSRRAIQGHSAAVLPYALPARVGSSPGSGSLDGQWLPQPEIDVAESRKTDALLPEPSAVGVGNARTIDRSRDVGLAVPSPSPDGETLLVMRDEHPGKRPFTSGLWLVDVDGRNMRRLVEVEEGQLDRVGRGRRTGERSPSRAAVR